MSIYSEIERRGAVGIVALNRPDARNALNLGLLQELRRAIAEVAADKTVRAVVLTGRGGAFCAGADVKEWSETTPESVAAAGTTWIDEALALVREIHDLPKPVIAMIDGAAVGAGLDMALACDFRYASARSKFICSYTNVGYSPDCGGSWLMPRVMGLEASKRFAYTGELWMAETALANRLISHVSADAQALLADTMAFAEKLAAGPTVAIGLTKTLLNASADRSLAEQQKEEVAAGEICATTNDNIEGLAATMERRAPNFTGT